MKIRVRWIESENSIKLVSGSFTFGFSEKQKSQLWKTMTGFTTTVEVESKFEAKKLILSNWMVIGDTMDTFKCIASHGMIGVAAFDRSKTAVMLYYVFGAMPSLPFEIAEVEFVDMEMLWNGFALAKITQDSEGGYTVMYNSGDSKRANTLNHAKVVAASRYLPEQEAKKYCVFIDHGTL